MSRPTKLSTTIVRKLEDALKLGCTIKEACHYAEISTSSYYEWISNNSEFSDKMKVLKKYLVIKSKAIIAKSLDEGNLDTAKWYLTRELKKELNPDYKEELPQITGIQVQIIDKREQISK